MNPEDRMTTLERCSHLIELCPVQIGNTAKLKYDIDRCLLTFRP